VTFVSPSHPHSAQRNNTGLWVEPLLGPNGVVLYSGMGLWNAFEQGEPLAFDLEGRFGA